MGSTCLREESSHRPLWVGYRTKGGRSIRADLLSTPVVFVQAGKPAKAMIAYEKALEWRELFDLAVREGTPQGEIAEMGLRVAGEIPLFP